MRALVFAVEMFAALTAVAVSSAIEGDWETIPGQFQERDTLSVRQLRSGEYTVTIATVFCPTNTSA
jgi:hypothetical protein